MEEWEWTPHLLLPSLHYSPCAEPIWGRVFEDDGRRGWGERDGTGDKEMRDRRKGPSPSHREKLAVHFVLIFLDSFEACVRKTTPHSLHRSVFPSRRSLPKSLPEKKREQTDEKRRRTPCSGNRTFRGVSSNAPLLSSSPFLSEQESMSFVSRQSDAAFLRDEVNLRGWGGGGVVLKSLDLHFLIFCEWNTWTAWVFHIFIPLHVCIWV